MNGLAPVLVPIIVAIISMVGGYLSGHAQQQHAKSQAQLGSN